MKVLIASRRTQGERPGDFSWTVEGELVHFPVFVCDLDRRAAEAGEPLGGCGCGRAFAGMSSHKAGTTAEVADLDISREEYAAALASSLHACGWIPHEQPADPGVQEMAGDLLEFAASYPVGTVLGHELYEVVRRFSPAPR
jgi:hypothetical protein